MWRREESECQRTQECQGLGEGQVIVKPCPIGLMRLKPVENLKLVFSGNSFGSVVKNFCVLEPKYVTGRHFGEKEGG